MSMTPPSDASLKPPADSLFPDAWRLAATIAVGAVGGLLLFLVGFPAAWLTGSAVAVAVYAVLGRAVPVPRNLQRLAFLLIGVSMGGGITPDTMDRISEWPGSIGLVVVVISLATVAGYRILTRGGGWDPTTAICGAIPGNLSLVVATALQQGAAVERVAIAHTLRLLVLLVIVPPAVAMVSAEAVSLAKPPAAGVVDTLILLAGGLAAAGLAHLIRMPGGILIGSFIGSGALHASGIVEAVLPVPIVGAALLLLGTSIGTRFAGIDLATFLRVLAIATASLAASLTICLLPAALFSYASGLPLSQVLLAFAPGGLEAMITLAFVLDSDVPYVAALQMIRVVTLALALPVLLRFVAGKRPGRLPRDAG